MLRLFGRELEMHEWARFLGVPDGARIALSGEMAFDHAARVQVSGIMATIEHHWYAESSTRVVYRDPQNRLVVENAYLHLRDEAPSGTGTRLLAYQVREAVRLGVQRIVTQAAGRPGPELNGYYTWAVLGFNGVIPPTARRALARPNAPEHLRDVTDMHDLILRPGGVAWWKVHGRTWDGEFDLAEGSTHRRILRRYTEAKGISI
jgi:hypothetical protein